MPAGVSAYVPLANLTLNASAATVTFSSINQSYRDLILIIDNAKEAASNGASMLMRFNTNSTSIYTNIYMSGNGTSASSSTGTDTAFYLSSGQGMSTTNPQNFIVNMMDYSATDKHKSILVRNNMPSNMTAASAPRCALTAAITTVTLLPFTGSIATGTTFALYGVSA